MAKKSAPTALEIRVNALLEAVDHKLALLLEGQQAFEARIERRLAESQEHSNLRFDALEAAVRHLSSEVTDLKAGQTRLEQRQGALEQRQGALEQRQGALEQRQGALEQRQGALEQRQGALERGQNEIKVQISEVLGVVTHHEGEIAKIWTAIRPSPRRSRAKS